MTTPRKPTQRALRRLADDLRRALGAELDRAGRRRRGEPLDRRRLDRRPRHGQALIGTRLDPGSSPCSGVSLIGLLVGRPCAGAASDASGRRPRRDQAGLAERHRQWPEGDLAGVDRQHAGAIDRDREAVHATRGGPERGPVRLDPEPVVARPVARALEPEVLEARVRLAAEVRAALVQRPDVERLAVAGRVLALR